MLTFIGYHLLKLCQHNLPRPSTKPSVIIVLSLYTETQYTSDYEYVKQLLVPPPMYLAGGVVT